MIIWAMKNAQQILVLANIGVGMEWAGRAQCIFFLRFNTYLHNMYYVLGTILGVL